MCTYEYYTYHILTYYFLLEKIRFLQKQYYYYNIKLNTVITSIYFITKISYSKYPILILYFYM